jgi:hypothetical protein
MIRGPFEATDASLANEKWQMADRWLEILRPSVICHVPFAMPDSTKRSTVPYYVGARSPRGRGWAIRTGNRHLIDPAQRVADPGIGELLSAFASASPSLWIVL